MTDNLHSTVRSFSTHADAELFMNDQYVEPPFGEGNSPPKYYAIQSGRVPGVYTDWPTAQAQIVGWSKPKYKSFSTRAEAEAFVKPPPTNGQATSSAAAMNGLSSIQEENSKKKVNKKADGAPAAKKQKPNGHVVDPLDPFSYDPGEGPLPEDAEDDFDPRIILNPDTGRIEYKNETLMNATKVMPKKISRSRMLNIYTDGSALANGQEGAVAGVGVYFGPGDRRYVARYFHDNAIADDGVRNVSEPLPGPRQTNQRAELTAIQRALDMAPIDRHATIYSDSNYAINCVTTWSRTWRNNGWMTSAKKPVENKDLVEAILDRLDDRTACGAVTEFQWLKGHADDPGNTAADALAVKGAKKGREIQEAGGSIPYSTEKKAYWELDPSDYRMGGREL